MVTAQGPAGPRRRMGAELRRLRTDAGLHLEEVAACLGCSTSKVSRLETGKGIPKMADVRRLIQIYDVDSTAARDMLTRLTRESREHGWWEPYTDGVASERFVLDTTSRYAALETEAATVRTFDQAAVHGLLQTPAYAHAVMTALLPQHRSEEIDQLVELRSKRQEALTTRTPLLSYAAVLDESILRRSVGGPGVMAGQLRALQEISSLPTVCLQVLPFSVGMHRAHAGRFVILEFLEGLSSDVVYVEGPAGDTYLEGEADVAVYKDVFDDVAGRALDPDASLDVIARYHDSYSPRGKVTR